jgi:hypothetical protein
MTGSDPLSSDDEEKMRFELETEFNALLEQYRRRFGQEPDWWVLGSSDDRAREIREAIETGKPIELNIPPGSVA